MDDLISRQAAIEELKTCQTYLFDAYDKYPKIPLEEAEYAIQCLPSAQPDLNEWCTDCKEYDKEKHCCPRFNRVIRQALKDAQPERKRGKWILGEIETGAFNVQYQWKRCSECGWKSSLVIPENFCPSCGADMRGKQYAKLD